jgi:hypothetical protein
MANPEEALRYLQFAERAGSLEYIELQVKGRSLRARMMVRRGVFEDAEGLARKAAEVADRTDFLNLRGDALVDLADVLFAAGKPESLRCPRAHQMLTEPVRA